MHYTLNLVFKSLVTSSKWFVSLSLKALLKQGVNNFNIFFSTYKNEGVNVENWLDRHIKTGLRILFNLSSLLSNSLGCYS